MSSLPTWFPMFPMPLGLWLAFCTATALLIAFPGPSILLMVSHSMGQGARRTLATVAGTALAITLQLAVTVAGVNSFMVLLAEWFEVLRWAGVVYLLWMGLAQWRASLQTQQEHLPKVVTRRSLFWQGFAVGVTNPKMLLFYGAFFPQFFDPALPAAPQLALLAVSFFLISVAICIAWVFLAGKLAGSLRGARSLSWRLRMSGTLLLGAGAALALAHRS